MDRLQVCGPVEAGGSTCDAPPTLSRGSESSAENRPACEPPPMCAARCGVDALGRALQPELKWKQA